MNIALLINPEAILDQHGIEWLDFGLANCPRCTAALRCYTVQPHGQEGLWCQFCLDCGYRMNWELILGNFDKSIIEKRWSLSG